MAQKMQTDPGQPDLCGQAHAVSDILSRTASLPVGLSLTIEEILERAWEIAYRKHSVDQVSNVVSLEAFRGSRIHAADNDSVHH